MKLYFMKQDAVDFMKHNMERLYTHYFQNETNEWMSKEYGSDPFSEFMDVPDFELAEIDAMSIGEVDFENCKILYNNLRLLSESQCSDERLWAGLCNSTFYSYMRRRYQYPSKQLKKKESDASAVISRFYFSGGTRAGFFRNGLAKCWWVGRATFDKDNDNHFAKLDIIGANDLTTKVSDIFYSNTFASNPTILAGICDALKYFNDHGQTLDEKKHVRAAMQYLNAVGGATLLDVLSREEICKIMTSRIIAILKGQSTDISFEEDDEDQLLEEVLEEDDDESVETFDDAEKYNESDYKKTINECDTPVERTNIPIYTEVPHIIEHNKETISLIQNEIKTEEPLASKPLNWFDEESNEDQLPGPEYITYGCWVKVLDEKDNKEIIYHIPLKDNHSRAWFVIEEKMLGQNRGFHVFLRGKTYRVLDFGRDNDIKDTKPEFITSSNKAQKEPLSQSKDILGQKKNEELAFYKWLKNKQVSDQDITQFKELVFTLDVYNNINVLDKMFSNELETFKRKRLASCSNTEKRLYKFIDDYLSQLGFQKTKNKLI